MHGPHFLYHHETKSVEPTEPAVNFSFKILIKKNTGAKFQQFHIMSVYSLIKSYMVYFLGLRRVFCF